MPSSWDEDDDDNMEVQSEEQYIHPSGVKIKTASQIIIFWEASCLDVYTV